MTAHSGMAHPGLCLCEQEVLQVDAQQIRAAKGLWKETSQELEHQQAQRKAILDRMQQLSVQPQDWVTCASSAACGAGQLLRQVAELTENALLEVEILGHASRVLSYQICSPDSIARLVCYSWPAFPDLLGALKAVAAMPEA